MFSCISTSVYQCVRVSVCSTCICSLVYQCVRVSMCTCISSLVYQCDRVSVHTCVCVSVCPCILLIDLATLLFLNQQVSTPTRKSNVLDLIFCSDELIKSVDVSECSFSDHCLIKTETYITVDPITIQAKCINPSLTSFEKFDFNRSDWINLSQSLKFTNWVHELDQVSPDEILPVAMNILISKCSIHVPLKRPKEARKSKFPKERRVLMRKRTKLSRIILRTPQIISQLLSIEEQISSSHLKEKIHEEHVAVS